MEANLNPFSPGSRLEADNPYMGVLVPRFFTIIALSGGSRQTLYSLFGGKQGVFEAMIAGLSADIFRSFDAIDLLDRAPDDMLTDIGVQYLQAVLTPEALGTYRLLLAEGKQMRDLVGRFWDMGPGHMRALLGGYFTQQVSRGRLRLPDPEQAANQFLGSLLSNYQLQCMLGLREIPGRKEIEIFARSAVDRFLNGCRIR